MGDETKDYTKLTDEEIVDAVCDAVSGAAVLSSRHRDSSDDDEKCRALYREAVRREKPELYESGYRQARKSFGY